MPAVRRGGAYRAPPAAPARPIRRAAPRPRGSATRRNLMNTALWLIVGLLAAVFLFAGANKLFIPREKLARAPGGGWVLDVSPGFVKALGAVEILGAVGL